jgi:hypothetical protein
MPDPRDVNGTEGIAAAMSDAGNVRQPIQLDWLPDESGVLQPKIAGAVVYEVTPDG